MKAQGGNSQTPIGLDHATKVMIATGGATVLVGVGLIVWHLLETSNKFEGGGLSLAVVLSGLGLLALGFARATGRWSCCRRISASAEFTPPPSPDERMNKGEQGGGGLPATRSGSE